MVQASICGKTCGIVDFLNSWFQTLDRGIIVNKI
jgi:hypothetical protein